MEINLISYLNKNKLFKLIWQKKKFFDNKSWKYFFTVYRLKILDL